jgi:hypothetical protein
MPSLIFLIWVSFLCNLSQLHFSLTFLMQASWLYPPETTPTFLLCSLITFISSILSPTHGRCLYTYITVFALMSPVFCLWCMEDAYICNCICTNIPSLLSLMHGRCLHMQLTSAIFCFWCRWAACRGASRECGLWAAPPRVGLANSVPNSSCRCLQVTLQPCVAPATTVPVPAVSIATALSLCYRLMAVTAVPTVRSP